MSFDDALRSRAAAIEAALMDRMAALPDDPVCAAMRYGAEGGKRLRGFLVVESAVLVGVPDRVALTPAAAIEALHAYSLVHDDLPAMDDDDLRRGRPTVHRRWDEATAILAGDGLLTLAFGLIAETDVAADRRVTLVRGLSVAAGAAGMVLGQARDIAAETAARPLDLHGIETLQALKTGALIEWSATAGPVMAGEDPAPLAAYARAIGRAFQIADDLLDVEGDADAAGKRLRKDEAAGKATFVSLLGVDGARRRARDLTDEAIAALAPYGDRAALLADTARFIVTRRT